MIRAFLLISAVVLSPGPVAHGYPMFFKCDAEGQATDIVTPKELSTEITKAVKSTGLKDVSSLSPCKSSECETQLDRTIQLLAQNKARAIKSTDGVPLDQIVNSYQTEQKRQLEEKMRKYVDSTMALVQFPASAMDVVRENARSQARVQACRMAFRELDVNDFIHDEGVLFCAPHSDQYTDKIMGCKTADKKTKCEFPSVAGLEHVVEEALQGGVDPYLFMAIGIMEKGPAGYFNHELDPHAIPGAMGRYRSSETSKVFIYGKERTIQSGVTEDAGLTEKLVRAAELERVRYGERHNLQLPPVVVPNGKQYYICYAVDGGYQTSEKPIKGQTCFDTKVKLNPEGKGGYASLFRSVLLKDFMQKRFAAAETKNGKGWKQVADAIQTYNGRSTLFGSTERAPGRWHLGINLQENPVYGYEALDIVANSFMTNPVLNGIVEKARKRLKEKGLIKKLPRNIMCAQASADSMVYLDTEQFYRKINETPRFAGFDKKKWGQLSAGERYTMAQELGKSSVLKKMEEKLASEGKSLPAIVYSPSYPETQRGLPAEMRSAQFVTADGKTAAGVGDRLTRNPDGTTKYDPSRSLWLFEAVQDESASEIELEGSKGTFVFRREHNGEDFKLYVNGEPSWSEESKAVWEAFRYGQVKTESGGQVKLPDYSLVQKVRVKYGVRDREGNPVEGADLPPVSWQVRYSPAPIDDRGGKSTVAESEVFETYKQAVYPDAKNIYEVGKNDFRAAGYSEKVWSTLLDTYENTKERRGGIRVISKSVEPTRPAGGL